MAHPITESAPTDCLLVVDGEKSSIQILESMLGKFGFEILPAADETQALKWLALRRPDLILLDIFPPGMDGLKLGRRILENSEWADIPIIFFSTSDDNNLIVQALEGGGADYLKKPFHRLELLSRVRTQLMLKTSRDHAKRLAQDKDELVAAISHHLQNSLTGIQMSSQLLLSRTKAAEDPKLRLMAENIHSSANQLRSFVKGFLANAAADHGLSIKLEPVSVADAAIRAVRQYEEAAQAKEIVVRTSVDRNHAPVLADSAALDQVLDNLISNSIKFSPHGKEVLVTVQHTPSHVEFRIQDQGAGFTEEDKSRIFRRYARLSARPTAGEPSTGLGLSIAKKLVQAMKGEIVCESTPRQGATFIVRLARIFDREAHLGELSANTHSTAGARTKTAKSQPTDFLEPHGQTSP